MCYYIYMIQSKYKHTTELGVKAGQLAFKLRSKKKDTLINIFVPIAILLMVGVLIFDIYKGANIVLDIILLVLLVIIEIMNITMPFIIARSQKKYLKNLEAQEYDYYITEYNKGVFKEKIYKDNKMVYANEITAEKLIGYAEFEHYVLVVFDSFASLVFDTDNMQEGSKEDLIKVIKSNISNNQVIKSKKK